jgi:hypothetical protein
VRQVYQCLTAAAQWQQWPQLSLTPAAGHQLDVVTLAPSAQPGDSYDIDGLALTRG